MRIVWHGHSCFEVDDSSVVVVIDPHDGKSLGIKPPSASANVVLASHSHYDHCAFRVIRGVHEDIVEKNGSFVCLGIEIEGLPVFHDQENGGKFGTNTIYTFKMDGISLCHCGDIGSVPSSDIIGRIKGVDILIVPAGEVNTMNMENIEKMISIVSPKVVIPMHYQVCGLSIPLRNLDNFIEMAGNNANYVGSEIDISKEELPDELEYWIFSR